ncbi:MAG: glycosyltransferase family 4 protein [Gammaproteobacteria bacterium]|nr:glycosyltransferase family 4 protein [Gammaproteobacteria bacterium]
MRILFSSHVFAPSVGGLESVSQTLATEFVRQGHEVRLITRTPGTVERCGKLQVLRAPGAAQLLGLARWCDVYFHNNISLPRAWPLLCVRRPWIVAHHVWIPRRGLAARLKRLALQAATSISVSHAIARDLPVPSHVIPNPYDDATFRELPDVGRSRDLVFLGRLVSDKGADLLLSALARLRAGGLVPSLTIIGSGPEEAALRRMSEALGLAGAVSFVGECRGAELVRRLNAHRIIVVPSRWQEPFGVVALEGLACGCIPVASSGGGLREAIGECGITFPNGDAAALSEVLGNLLREPERVRQLRARARDHLRRHTAANVAQEYLGVFDQVLEGSGYGRARTRSI